MKLIIDIPDLLYYHEIEQASHNNSTPIEKAIAQGIPYEERPQGEWEEGNHGDYERPDFYFQCSVCKEETDDTTPYCPFCGSRMKGGEEE